jgi:type II secretory pathway predicted ATPase ExeA
MYYAHFGLTQPPFKITPDTDFFYPGGSRGAVLDALIYAVTQGEGIVKVSGEVGSGKTMLCRMLQDRLPQSVEVVYLANPNVAPEDIVYAIALELHLPVTRDMGRLEVGQAVQAHLLARHEENKRVVLFVEEAQGMPLATLEEIRLLSNLETRHDKLLQIVLFGQPELDVNLGQPHIRQLRERITHSFALAPLNAAEIREYLMFRLRAAGYRGPDLFDAATVRLIARASRGLTRRVNIVADKALLAAFAANTHTIAAKHVRAAIDDSEFSSAKRTPVWVWGLAAMLVLAALVEFGIGLQDSPRPAHAQFKAAPAVPDAVPPARNDIPAPPTPSVAQDPLEARLKATLSWLESQPPDTYSIQVMGSNDAQQLRDYLTQNSGPMGTERIFVYRTLASGKPSMTVLYGSYASRKEAAAALAQLPPQLKQGQPYLRSVQGVRAELGQARSTAQ